VALLRESTRRGVRVTVVSTIASQTPMIADELRRQADEFIDLAQSKLKLGRNLSDPLDPRQNERRARKSECQRDSERPAESAAPIRISRNATPSRPAPIPVTTVR